MFRFFFFFKSITFLLSTIFEENKTNYFNKMANERNEETIHLKPMSGKENPNVIKGCGIKKNYRKITRGELNGMLRYRPINNSMLEI